MIRAIAIFLVSGAQVVIIYCLLRQGHEIGDLRRELAEARSTALAEVGSGQEVQKGGGGPGRSQVPNVSSANSPTRSPAELRYIGELIGSEVGRRLSDLDRAPLLQSIEVLGRALQMTANQSAAVAEVMEQTRKKKAQIAMKIRTGELTRGEILTQITEADATGREQLKGILGDEGLERLFEYLRQRPEMVARDYLGFEGHAESRTERMRTRAE